MKRYKIEITSIDPLAIGTDRSVSNRVETYRYLPGTVLRGAMAAAWIAECGPPDANNRSEFAALFEGPTIFSPAIPSSARFEQLSVARCKYRPMPGCGAFARDLAMTGKDSLPLCDTCEGPTALGKGAMLGVETVERTRTALEGGQAKEGALYTRSAIPKATRLEGEILTTDPGAAHWLEDRAGSMLWLGGGRSTGGRAIVEKVSVAPLVDPAGLAVDKPAILRLESPAILVDPATRPVTEFSDDLLGDIVDAPVSIERQWVRSERVGGWNAVAGTPKPQEVALSAGSTVRFVPTSAVDGDILGSVVAAGIGLRRNEGFGRVSFDPSPWLPPPARSLDEDSSDSRAMALFREAAHLGLADRQEIEAAIVTSSVSTGDADLNQLVGRDYSRRLDDPQRDWLKSVLSESGAVLNDLAACLEDHRTDSAAENGNER